MGRYAFLMRLRNESCIEPYERLHQEVWEEVLRAHARSGIRNYSIFRSGLDLFAYLETDELEESLKRLAQEPVMADWWRATGRLLEAEPDGRPALRVLSEVFHMDGETPPGVAFSRREQLGAP